MTKNFIKLTEVNGKTFLLDVEGIICIGQVDKTYDNVAYTQIDFFSGHNAKCKETVDEIYSLLFEKGLA